MRWLLWLRIGVFIAALGPLARLVVLGVAGGLDPNPVEFITRSTGTWALVFLCVTLAVTPVRRLTGWNFLIKLRRMLGLYAFFYASLHFVAFIWFDHFFDFGAMLTDVIKRPFVTVGFIAFVLLLPLALTSTHASIRWLGGKRWQLLHRLIYLIACLAILHFWWHKAGKNDLQEPLLYGAVVVLLLGARVAHALQAASARKQSIGSARQRGLQSKKL